MVFIIDDNLQPYSEQEFSEFESINNVTLPNEHKGFLSKYGAGIYCNFLIIHPLEVIIPKTKLFRQILTEYPYFFWPQSNSIISEEDAQYCYVIADSLDGDTLAYVAGSDRFIMFPRHSEIAINAPDIFDDPLSWLGAENEEALSYPKVFTPNGYLMTKRVVLQGKKPNEDLRLHAEKIEAIHKAGEYLRQSEKEAETFYSKRWAGRLQLTKFNTLDGDRLALGFRFNKSQKNQVESDFKKLFRKDYKIVTDE